jgi:hypothetical protein
MFKKGSGSWTQYRQLPSLIEIDFHHSGYEPREMPYEEAMGNVWHDALEALRTAYQQGKRYVLFTHGSSTSRPGKTTARSQVRGLMRSKEATPYICRSECIQHETVFVAAIRPNPNV